MLQAVACTGTRPTTATAAAALALALAAALSGCGGGSGAGRHAGTAGSDGMMGGGHGSTPMGSSTVTPGTTTAATDGDGRSLFVASGCGACHTLAVAGTTGTAGPNLDEAQLDYARVVRIVADGSGGMPAFGDTLGDSQIRSVARFVASATG